MPFNICNRRLAQCDILGQSILGEIRLWQVGINVTFNVCYNICPIVILNIVYYSIQFPKILVSLI